MGRLLGSRNKNKEILYKLDGNGCWIGLRCLSQDGYPRFHFEGKSTNLSRYFFKKYKGNIPDNKELDHLCRNRKCVNPNHLEAVTRAENVRRGLVAKLNYKIVDKIKKFYKRSDINQYLLAQKFNVNQSTISRIVNGKRWAE